jgi:hypothetical protein
MTKTRRLQRQNKEPATSLRTCCSSALCCAWPVSAPAVPPGSPDSSTLVQPLLQRPLLDARRGFLEWNRALPEVLGRPRVLPTGNGTAEPSRGRLAIDRPRQRHLSMGCGRKNASSLNQIFAHRTPPLQPLYSLVTAYKQEPAST